MSWFAAVMVFGIDSAMGAVLGAGLLVVLDVVFGAGVSTLVIGVGAVMLGRFPGGLLYLARRAVAHGFGRPHDRRVLLRAHCRRGLVVHCDDLGRVEDLDAGRNCTAGQERQNVGAAADPGQTLGVEQDDADVRTMLREAVFGHEARRTPERTAMEEAGASWMPRSFSP